MPKWHRSAFARVLIAVMRIRRRTPRRCQYWAETVADMAVLGFEQLLVPTSFTRYGADARTPGGRSSLVVIM